MSSTVLYMSMSLDGFVAGPNEHPGNGLGDGGRRLHEWFLVSAPTEHSGVPGRPRGANGEVMDELIATAPWSPAGEKDVLVDGVGTAQLALDPVRVVEGDGVTHLRYRVRR